MQSKKLFDLFLISIFSLSIFSLSFSVHAQDIAIGELVLVKSVESPKPGQDISISLRNYAIDLDTATIIWRVDGVEKKRGVGQKSFTTKAPAIGKNSTVTAVVVTTDSDTYSGDILLGSGSMDIIVESAGYTPPFFLGKIPLAYENIVKVVAMPHLADSSGKEFDPDTLIYTWEKDGSVRGDLSGYGKRSITFTGSSIPSPVILTVTAKTRDGLHQAKEYKTLTYSQPFIKFYSNDPLYGPLFNRELSGTKYINKEKELGILAVPYGFDKPVNSVGKLSFQWKIDGSIKSNLNNNESIIVRSPEGAAGTSGISFKITNSIKTLQTGQSAFSVSFGDSGTTNTNPVSF